ncbi:MAG: haloacid dehalogenase-like hydrolase [Thermoleophilia bacterium]|nr:haloacid dehalogenase-like hydrolase [Thermoleophilia bacterium]
MADAAVDLGLQAWMRAAAAAYPAQEAAHPRPVALPGAADAVAAMAGAGVRLGLLTGNLEPIGRAKLRAAGFSDALASAPGGFGSDHEDRRALVPVARARAGGGFAGPATVVVGDTPRDIACARAAGARVVGVTTGPHPAGDLAAADAVAGDLAEVARVIAAWAPPQ